MPSAGVSGLPKPPPREIRQDIAPPGGYPPININRNVPKSISTSGAIALFVGGALAIAWGFQRVGTFNTHRRALKQEKREIRLALLPLLQAEEDLLYVKEMKKYREWEADVMKEVPNWDSNGNVYKTKSFVQPALSEFVYNR